MGAASVGGMALAKAFIEIFHKRNSNKQLEWKWVVGRMRKRERGSHIPISMMDIDTSNYLALSLTRQHPSLLCLECLSPLHNKC